MTPFGSEFNFAHLMSFDIGQIQVLRGPKNALYGSDSIGSVISISTPEASKAGIVTRAEVMGGSMKTSQAGVAVTGKSDGVSGHFSASRYDTEGISISAMPSNNEKDGYKNTTLHGKLGVELTPDLHAKFIIRHVNSHVNTDQFDYISGLTIDGDSASDSSQLYGLAELNLSLFNDALLQKLSYGLTDTSSDFLKDKVTASGNRGKRQNINYQTTVSLDTGPLTHAITGGIQYEQLKFRSVSASYASANQKQTDQQTSFVGEYALGFNDTGSISISLRHDQNDMFDDATSITLQGLTLLLI